MTKRKRKIVVFLRRIKWRWFSKEEGCIICWGGTGVLKKTPTDKRTHYIPGCGQVCEKCANEMEDERYLSRQWEGVDNSTPPFFILI
jgi:hypothetical protein